MRTRNGRIAGLTYRWALALALGAASTAFAQSKPIVGQARLESIARADGQATYGRVSGDARSGFKFTPIGGEPAVSLEQAGVVTFDGPGADASLGYPPMRILLGLDQQISGRLGSVDERSIKFEDGPGGHSVVVDRAGAMALAQRPGEILVIQDGFETLDPNHWSVVGEPKVVDQPRTAGSKSLAIPTGGSAVTYRLAEPIASGRLEVAFYDSGQVVSGQQWFVDLLFRGTGGEECVRAVLDWSEESLAVQSPGSRHSLAVQRLARKPGWHRLRVRFGVDTELSVDGDELAHGVGPGGPLIEVRLANRTTGNGEVPKGLAVNFDDFRLVRLAEPVGGLEVTPKIDDVRLVDGDQVFGLLKAADAEAVGLKVDGRDISLPWSEVASLYFRRSPNQARPIEGLLVRIEWRSAPGNDPRDLDQVEGALLSVTDAAFAVATPYSGDLTIPRERLRKLKVLGRGRRIVLDSTSHHLGNNDTSKDSTFIDPPQPEGGTLGLAFKLDRVPEGAAFVVLDVVQVEGEANSLKFAREIANGELRTNVKLNDKPIDYLNRHITTKNENPERIRLPIPAGLLRPGENRLQLDQVPMLSKPEELDDIGILGIALEFEAVKR
jgi:hypothetical protein